MNKKERLITKKGNREEKISNEIENIYFKKNKERTVKKIAKTSAIIVITVVSGLFITAYMDNEPRASLNSSKQKGIIALKDKELIDKEKSLEKHTLLNIENNIVLIKSGGLESIGAIFKDSSYIIANGKEIHSKKDIKVKFNDKNECSGEFLGEDPLSKIAIIKVNKKDIKPVKFDDDINISTGDKVIIVEGKDKIKNKEMFLGNIDDINKKVFNNSDLKIKDKDLINLIKTNVLKKEDIDSNIFIYNESGNLVGINFAIKNKVFSESTYSGFHIYEVQEIIDKILSDKNNVLKSIGIAGKSAIPTVDYGVRGLYIQKVAKGSLGEIANIRPTDIIISINGKGVKDLDELSEILTNHEEGEKLVLKIWRNGEIIYNDISSYRLK